MPRVLDRYLPVITYATSLPLFFSFQLENPPEFLQGLLFVALWTWGALAAIALPILLFLEIVMCARLLLNRPTRRSTLWRHAAALLGAVVAEVVFFLARRSLA
jgi:hypothetical protein